MRAPAIPLALSLLVACGDELPGADDYPFAPPRPAVAAPVADPHGLARAALRGDERLGRVETRRLGESGRTLVQVVAEAPDGAFLRDFVLDEHGREVDPRAMARSEREAYRRRYGVLSPALLDTVRAGEDETLRVIVWTDLDGVRIPSISEGDELWQARHAGLVAQALAPRQEQVALLVAELGGSVEHVGQHDPTIVAWLPRRALLSRRLNTSSLVASVELPTPAGERHDWEGTRSAGGPLVGCGSTCTGGATKVGLLETHVLGEGISQIFGGNSHLPHNASAPIQTPAETCSSDASCLHQQQFPVNVVCRNNKCVSEHATMVTSSIGASGSYGAYTNANSFNFRPVHVNHDKNTGVPWLIDQGVTWANHSMSGPGSPTHSFARLIDWYARTSNLKTFQSSANQADQVVECGAYSSVCVGAYHDGHNTPNGHGDDAIASFSSWQNLGVFADRELPHVVGPGVALSLAGVCADDGDWVSEELCDSQGVSFAVSGTSFASPFVLGQALAMAQYEQTLGRSLLSFPAAVKLLLMLGGRNIDGNELVIDSVDDKDGAGAPMFPAMKRILSSNTLKRLDVQASDFDSTGKYLTEFTVAVPPGKTLRAGLAYLSCGNALNQFPVVNNLATDFDLGIRRPMGSGIGDQRIIGSCYLQTCTPLAGCTKIPGGTVSSRSSSAEFEFLHEACMQSEATRTGSFVIQLRHKTSTGFQTCNGAASETVFLAWDVY